MRLGLHYRATYAYAEPVSLSPHVVRLFPRDTVRTHVEKYEFFTNEGADVHWRRDLFENLVARCFYPREADKLAYGFDAIVSVEERNPFGFLLDQTAVRLPIEYSERELAILAAHRQPSGAALPAALLPPPGADTVEALIGMNAWIYENIGYERREEGEAFPANLTLKRGRGACRDTAVLLAEALRQLGLAARLASGYLWESVSDPAERRAESAMHAWTEAYLPGAGWLPLDPSNGVLADHHYLTTAVGLVPQDIAPVSGLYFGDRAVPGELSTTLRIERL